MSALEPIEKTTAYKVKEALIRKYKDELFIPEFRDAPSGYSHRIDALLVWLHPSRSKHVECFEIKVSRADWLAELEHPLKSDGVAKHCDNIWLVTSNDKVARIEEIPDSWGWMSLKGMRLKVLKDAPDLEPIFDREFVITIAQAVDQKLDVLTSAAENIGYEQGYKKGKAFFFPEAEKREHERLVRELASLQEKFDAMKKITGRDFWWEDVEGVKDIVGAVIKLRDMREKYTFEALEDRLEDMQTKLDAAKVSISKLKDTTFR